MTLVASVVDEAGEEAEEEADGVDTVVAAEVEATGGEMTEEEARGMEEDEEEVEEEVTEADTMEEEVVVEAMEVEATGEVETTEEEVEAMEVEATGEVETTEEEEEATAAARADASKETRDGRMTAVALGAKGTTVARATARVGKLNLNSSRSLVWPRSEAHNRSLHSSPARTFDVRQKVVVRPTGIGDISSRVTERRVCFLWTNC